MVITMGQQFNVGEKPTVILYTYINRHAGTPTKGKTSPILKQLFPQVTNMLSYTANYAVLHIVVLGDNISLMLHLD